jgi:HEAT repeat protein
MPIPLTCTGCTQRFPIREEFAGTLVRCGCGRVLVVPDLSAAVPAAPEGRGPLFASLALLVVSLAVGAATLLWVTSDAPGVAADPGRPVTPAPQVAQLPGGQGEQAKQPHESQQTVPNGHPGGAAEAKNLGGTKGLPTEARNPDEKTGTAPETRQNSAGPKAATPETRPKVDPKPEPAPAPLTIEEAVKKLETTTDVVQCRSAVQAVARLRAPEARPAVPALLKAWARHGDVALRKQILNVLTTIGPPLEEDVGCLAEPLKDPDKQLRLYVIAALGQMRANPKAAVPVLVKALADPDAVLKARAVAVLGTFIKEIGPNARAQAFESLLGCIEDLDDEVGTLAARALWELKTLFPGEVDLLIRTVAAAKGRPKTRRVAALVLGKYGDQVKQAVPVLCRVLAGDADDKLLELAAESLGKIGVRKVDDADVVQTLLTRAVPHPVTKVSRAGLVALAQLGAETVPLKALVKAAEHDNAELRALGLELLKKKKPAKEEVGDLAAALKSPNADVAGFALDAVAQLGPAAAQVVPQVAVHLKAREYKAQSAAARALKAIGPAARAAVPDLRAALKEPPLDVDAAVALAYIDPKTPAVVQELTPILIRGLKPKLPLVAGVPLGEDVRKQRLLKILNPAEQAAANRENATVQKLWEYCLVHYLRTPEDLLNADNPDQLAEREEVRGALVQLGDAAGPKLIDEVQRNTGREMLNVYARLTILQVLEDLGPRAGLEFQMKGEINKLQGNPRELPAIRKAAGRAWTALTRKD